MTESLLWDSSLPDKMPWGVDLKQKSSELSAGGRPSRCRRAAPSWGLGLCAKRQKKKEMKKKKKLVVWLLQLDQTGPAEAPRLSRRETLTQRFI